ncbi:hypothetical protein KFK09_015636 [Dendrobium nobile]|uniref:Uncharacterized protein n=1 Tax=Dendrobium nobile TaxID=94219 RepID=A0A8T3B5C2_DENNO|nr:hypothetical protein KFK09_015636 [Dendrobium nobile]
MKAAGGQNAKDTLDLAFQISNVLDTGLDRHTLSLLIALLDRGINPEPLSALIRIILAFVSTFRHISWLFKVSTFTQATSGYAHMLLLDKYVSFYFMISIYRFLRECFSFDACFCYRYLK